jgi:CRP/FNR family transcriptional regulator, cyclic AMP receptor protein
MTSDPISTSTLHEIPFLADLSAQHLELLASLSTLRTAKDGEELFHEGDPQDYLYIVLEGRVALEIHIPNRGRLRILTVEPNELLGWSSVTNAIPRRTASARVVCDTRLMAIDSMRLNKACQDDPILGYRMMLQVANVIANRLVTTRIQMLDLFSNQQAEAHHG